MRQKIIAGNWKMHTTVEEANQLAVDLSHRVTKQVKNDVKMILCPPFPYLQHVRDRIKNIPTIEVGAQNCSEHTSGAYTGEVSALMLKSLEVTHVIIAHSERRRYFLEKETLLASKIDAGLHHGLSPIYCCGEPLEVRESGQEVAFVNTQIEEGLFHLNTDAIKKIIIAYEPVWAIGSGKSAKPQQIQEMHRAIRNHLMAKFGDATANSISILYGGSVTAHNAKAIFACADVDGGLIGGASLNAEEFVGIAQLI